MENLLKGNRRDKTGTKHADNLRSEGKIPGVLYGRKIDTVEFYVEQTGFEDMLRHHEKLIKLKIEDEEPVNALVQDVQYEPVHGDVIHFDLHHVLLDEAIEVEVPIEVKGAETSPGIKDGGNMELYIHDVQVSCLPHKIPESIVIDIGDMEIGDSKKIGDLPELEDAEILSDPEETLLSLLEPIDVEAATDIEESLLELEGAEPEVQKQKEPGEEEGEVPEPEPEETPEAPEEEGE